MKRNKNGISGDEIPWTMSNDFVKCPFCGFEDRMMKKYLSEDAPWIDLDCLQCRNVISVRKEVIYHANMKTRIYEADGRKI